MWCGSIFCSTPSFLSLSSCIWTLPSIGNLSLYEMLNILMISTLCLQLPQSSIRRTEESNLRRREMRLARISVLIVIIFIFCHSLKIIPSLLEILGYPPEVNIKYHYYYPLIYQLAAHTRSPACLSFTADCQLQCQLPGVLSRWCNFLQIFLCNISFHVHLCV